MLMFAEFGGGRFAPPPLNTPLRAYGPLGWITASVLARDIHQDGQRDKVKI